ncbi:MAG: hypothetical protein Kilf2KO_06860 [Rhodospirillales bacterium]
MFVELRADQIGAQAAVIVDQGHGGLVARGLYAEDKHAGLGLDMVNAASFGIRGSVGVWPDRRCLPVTAGATTASLTARISAPAFQDL